MKNIRPLHDVLVVKRQEPEAVSKGGLIIPEDAKEKSTTAEVLAVGPGDRSKSGARMPVDVKAGDTVLLGKYAGTGQELTVDGEKLLLVRSGDVLAVVGPADAAVEPAGGAAELLETGWGVISSVAGGDWSSQTPEWQKAAGEWRDRYFEWLRGQQQAVPANPLQGPDGEPQACPTCHQPPPGLEYIGAVVARS